MKSVALIFAFAAGTGWASQASAQPTDAAHEAIDPAAAAALERMGSVLSQLQEFKVHADLSTEDVLTDGQKIQLNGSIELLASRPNRMRAAVKMGQAERLVYYDGSSLTLHAPKLGFFAKVAAPPTIRETIDVAFTQQGIEIPLADLFFWSENRSLSGRVQSAIAIGVEPIGDQLCEHYAIRQEAVDWQIWIRQGQKALPCKLVITSKSDPAMPQHSATYTWLPAAKQKGDPYTFKAGKGDTLIRFMPLTATSTSERSN